MQLCSLAGLVLCFIACFILLVIAPLSQYIGDADIIARFRVRQLRVAVIVFTTKQLYESFNETSERSLLFVDRHHSFIR